MDQNARGLAAQHIAQFASAPEGSIGRNRATAQLDVFISYAGRDWNWARWLDFVLRAGGYSTIVHGFDSAVGKSFVHAMDEALKRARLVACLLSPAYLESRWSAEEWQAALNMDRLFLLRIADCELDGLLGPRAYLDLVNVSEDAAREMIVAAIKRRSGEDARPKERPAFPTKTFALGQPRFPGSLPNIWNIPDQRNPYFKGRDKLLRSMHEALSAGNTVALTQVVKGLGGVGKTQLALEYAHRYASEYQRSGGCAQNNP